MLPFVQNKYWDNLLKGKPLSSTVQVTDISLFTMITAVVIQKVVIILVLI